MTYEIRSPKIEAECPKHLRNKSAMEIVEYLRTHFKVDYENGQAPLNKSTEYMQAVAKACFDPTDWRNPIKVWFAPYDEWVKAAVVWYHGREAVSNGYWVYSKGYACW